MHQAIMNNDSHAAVALKEFGFFARRAILLLTPREKDCVSLWVLGNTMPVIGDVLSISSRTVETHLYNARGKLQQRTRQGLMLWLIDIQHYDHFVDHGTQLLKKFRKLREDTGFATPKVTLQ